MTKRRSAVEVGIALKRDLDEFARTGNKQVAIESLREEFCRRYRAASPEEALLLAVDCLMKEALPAYRKLSKKRSAAKIDAIDFGRYFSPKTGRAYLCPQPSKASVKRVIGKIRHATARNVLWLSAEEMVTGLNRVLVGWANYYSLGPVYQAYRAIDRYTPLRLRRWLCNKHKISNTGARCFPYEYLYDTLGLVQLQSLARSLPRAKA